MGCRAQILQNPAIGSVVPMTDCCENIIQADNDIVVRMVDIETVILTGRVTCYTGGAAVNGAIVVAQVTVNDTTTSYVGITNNDGYYAICVPNVNATYSIQAYRCCCTDEPLDADCTCPS